MHALLVFIFLFVSTTTVVSAEHRTVAVMFGTPSVAVVNNSVMLGVDINFNVSAVNHPSYRHYVIVGNVIPASSGSCNETIIIMNPNDATWHFSADLHELAQSCPGVTMANSSDVVTYVVPITVAEYDNNTGVWAFMKQTFHAASPRVNLLHSPLHTPVVTNSSFLFISATALDADFGETHTVVAVVLAATTAGVVFLQFALLRIMPYAMKCVLPRAHRRGLAGSMWLNAKHTAAAAGKRY